MVLFTHDAHDLGSVRRDLPLMTTALLLFFLCVQRQKKTKCLCHVYTLKLPDALLMLPALSLIIKGCFWPPTRSFCLYVWVFESISGEATVTVTEDWLKANGLWWYLLLFKDNSPDDRHLNLRQWKSTLRRRILCCRPERSQPPPASPCLPPPDIQSLGETGTLLYDPCVDPA